MIITAIISGLSVAVPSIIATVVSNKKSSALLTYRIDQLEVEQKKHNNLIERMYKVESDIKVIDEKIMELEKK